MHQPRGEPSANHAESTDFPHRNSGENVLFSGIKEEIIQELSLFFSEIMGVLAKRTKLDYNEHNLIVAGK